MVKMERRDAPGCILKTERTEFIAWHNKVVKGRTRHDYEAPGVAAYRLEVSFTKSKEESCRGIINFVLDLIMGYPNTYI